LLLWSFTRLYSSSRFFILALHWAAMQMDASPWSLNRLFSSLAMNSHTAYLCLLLIGWWSVHIVIRNHITASDQLGEQPLVLVSLLESSTPGPSPTPLALALWYGLSCDSTGESGQVNLACGSHSWFWKAGEMYRPRVGTGATNWSIRRNNEARCPKVNDLLN